MPQLERQINYRPTYELSFQILSHHVYKLTAHAVEFIVLQMKKN